MTILNLTTTPLSDDLKAEGVIDISGSAMIFLKTLMWFSSQPTSTVIRGRAKQIAHLAKKEMNRLRALVEVVLLDGKNPYLISALEEALMQMDIRFVYSYKKIVKDKDNPAEIKLVHDYWIYNI
jgi:hypothetical protein